MIEKILPDLFRITLPMPFRLRHVHVYALLHDGKVALFDTGMNIPETYRVLDEELATLGKTTKDIDHIFLTHFHADHCGIAGRLQEISGAAVYLSQSDEMRLQYNSRHEELVERARNFFLPQGLPQKAMDNLAKLMAVFRKATVPFRVDRRLSPGDSFSLGGRTVEVIAAPGHTAGQMCFYLPGEGILLAGDHILPDITPNLSPDIFRLEYRPLSSFLESLGAIRDLPVRMVYPAHGDAYPDLARRVDEIREHHAERTQLIVEALQGKEKTAFEVSGDIFGEDLPEFDQFLALNETYVHIVELVDRGEVRAVERGGLVRYHPV
ncbi:MAG: MBL fold metallo-hydrolase [Syntrophobacterales bacterium]|nr:MBL fold metallo-hydrolase [Syntrophobacterales bacterium]